MTPTLADRGCIVVEGLLDRRLARILYDVLLIRQWRGEFKRDRQIPDACSFWGDTTLDAVLIGLQPEIEAASGCQLLPTYSYARLYLQGQSLPRHRDRAACEIAVTIHLGYCGARPPPIQFAPDIAVHQNCGDAVIYLGDKLEHWRDVFEGTNFGQVFLNYVRADGSRQACLHDGRQKAFPPSFSPEKQGADINHP